MSVSRDVFLFPRVWKKYPRYLRAKNRRYYIAFIFENSFSLMKIGTSFKGNLAKQGSLAQSQHFDQLEALWNKRSPPRRRLHQVGASKVITGVYSSLILNFFFAQVPFQAIIASRIPFGFVRRRSAFRLR